MQMKISKGMHRDIYKAHCWEVELEVFRGGFLVFFMCFAQSTHISQATLCCGKKQPRI